jgi:ribose-phosphate pyrophosphokinase
MAIYVNDRFVQFGRYPNGETVVPRGLVRASDWHYPPLVRLHWEEDADLVKLALVHGQLAQEVVLTPPRLFVDYMPYSRMDRLQDGHCFSLRYIAVLVERLGWESIEVVEPHSDVTTCELRAVPVNATVALLPKVMESVNFDVTTDVLVLPDAGALARYREQAADIFDVCHLVVMRKARDFATGKIQGLEVDHIVTRGLGTGQNGLVERRALIVDDLSSRGGTFVQAADVLRDQLGMSQVFLLVTHMELAGFEGDLPTKLDHVYCTDTLLPAGHSLAPKNFTIFKRSDWL